jgi:DNA recombination protein RmuC
MGSSSFSIPDRLLKNAHLRRYPGRHDLAGVPRVAPSTFVVNDRSLGMAKGIRTCGGVVEAYHWVLILIVAVGGLIFLLLDRRWTRMIEQARQDQTSGQSWAVVQQQLDQLRGQVNEGMHQNISLLTEQLRVIHEQVNLQLQTVNQQLQTSQGQIGQRLDSAARVIGEVKENLGKLSKTSDQIYEVGKNIATLQEILRPPKLRGGLGELFLGELLSQILPPEFFSLQHTFSSGERVDAVVKLGKKFVPIDSKFPLDNFKRMIEVRTEEEKRASHRLFVRDVKKHIDDIAGKYIVPDEGTYDFALLYIPAENVYYETITKDDSPGEEKSILNYALKKRVVPVSPNSFYAYLQVIILGLKGLKIEDHAREIQLSLAGLGKDLREFQEDFRLVGKHLIDARNRFDEARGRLEKLSYRLEQIEGQPASAISGVTKVEEI